MLRVESLGRGAADRELPEWSWVREKVGGARLRRVRKGVCCCEEARERTPRPRLPEWDRDRLPRSGLGESWWRGGALNGCGQA